jgi:folate-dependent phosphoribosylglycinamide formyltransferase PurN
MTNKKIVLLASNCESSIWVYHAIKKHFQLNSVILEKPLSKKALFKRRVKKIGLFKTINQVFFSVLFVPFLKSKGKKRKLELVKKYNLVNELVPTDTYYIDTVNSNACKELLVSAQPDIVVVNGTRIISKEILECCNAIFINMHVGITPHYRGSHGGYWALYHNDAKNFGTTIHIVDKGVDTGGVIKQVFGTIADSDNFTTYPVLQAAIGIQVIPEVINSIINNNYNVTTHKEKGKLYQQPTIWEYLKNRKVK